MRIVMKFGGSSLATAAHIRRAAQLVSEQRSRGNQVAVVVSAQGHTTDELLKKALELNPRGSVRELDACLAAGEQVSASLMAMAIGALGYPAVSLTGWQAGIHTDGNHGNARIRHINTGRLRKELSAGKIVVVSGFQGVDDDGDITTLGRGGSDTTAVALAAWLRADRCLIYTDVDAYLDHFLASRPELYCDDQIRHRVHAVYDFYQARENIRAMYGYLEFPEP